MSPFPRGTYASSPEPNSRYPAMRIGIVPELNPSFGGLHQYSQSILKALASLQKKEAKNELILFIRPEQAAFLPEMDAKWQKVMLPSSLKARVEEAAYKTPPGRALMRVWKRLRHQAMNLRHMSLAEDGTETSPPPVNKRRRLAKKFVAHEIDWVFYTAPTSVSFQAGLPYVMPIHDLQHRINPQFPEVSIQGAWKEREYLFRNATRHATLILADSEAGKEDILEFYGPFGITPDRIKVLPFLPAVYLTPDVPASQRELVRRIYGLPERYLFYPAQFWPHKNHIRIIEALGLLKEKENEKIHLVLCGSNSDLIRAETFKKLMERARGLGIDSQIHCLSYAPDGHMSALYAEAVALVMPTFFGPTNIPVLEAWALGCPVLTSDIRGIREQVGDAGILVNPSSAEAIADGIHRLWKDKSLRLELARKGFKRYKSYTPEDFEKRLSEIVEDACMKVGGQSKKGK